MPGGVHIRCAGSLEAYDGSCHHAFDAFGECIRCEIERCIREALSFSKLSLHKPCLSA